MINDEDDQLYIYKMYGVSKSRRIKADNNLRLKIGPTAKITEKQIEDAQWVIERGNVDQLYSYAINLVDKMESDISMLSTFAPYDREDHYDLMITPVVELKGQCAMFGNDFVTALSKIVIYFLEKYRVFDNVVLEIMSIFCRSTRLSFDKEIYEVGQINAQKLINELEYTIKWYEDRVNEKRKK